MAAKDTKLGSVIPTYQVEEWVVYQIAAENYQVGVSGIPSGGKWVVYQMVAKKIPSGGLGRRINGIPSEGE